MKLIFFTFIRLRYDPIVKYGSVYGQILLANNEAANRMNKESRAEIYKMMKSAEFEIARLNYCIERLAPAAKEVVRELFIEKCSWSYICVRNSISEKTLNKYRKKGIGEIIEMFDLKRMAR